MTNARLGIVLAWAGLLAVPAGATTLCVNPGGTSGCKSSISAAVAVAAAGDVIQVRPGSYNESVFIPGGKDGLQIVGASKLTTFVDPDLPLVGSFGIGIGANNVQVKNLTIRNGTGPFSIGISATGTIVQGVRIIGARGVPGPLYAGSGIAVGSGSSGIQILNNEIRACRYGVYFLNGVSNSTIQGNTIVGSSVAGIFMAGPTSALNLDNKVLANKISNAATGISIIGDTNSVNNNALENVPSTGLVVQGLNPVFQSNKLTAASGAVAFCLGCTGGSVKANTSLGSNNFGVAAVTDAAGFVVQGNKISQAAQIGLLLLGNTIQVTQNTVADVVAPSAVSSNGSCFLVAGTGHTLSNNSAQRCGGAGFYVNGDANTLNLNTSTGSNHNGFLVDGNSGGPPFTNAVLTGNKAISTSGQGFGVINGAVNTALTGNTSTKNRLDLCDMGAGTTVSPAFPSTSGTCNILQ
jgi:parallel beta-helix repeat protein